MYIASAMPPAHEISDKEIIQALQAQLRAQKQEMEQLRIVANTIANTAACLTEMHLEGTTEDRVFIPDYLRQRMQETKLSVESLPNGTLVRWVTRPNDHSFEGRVDG